jgi:hypothetical protein
MFKVKTKEPAVTEFSELTGLILLNKSMGPAIKVKINSINPHPKPTF